MTCAISPLALLSTILTRFNHVLYASHGNAWKGFAYALFSALATGRPRLKADDVLLAGVRARDLYRIVDGLGARVGEEEARQLRRADLQHPVQQRRLRARPS